MLLCRLRSKKPFGLSDQFTQNANVNAVPRVELEAEEHYTAYETHNLATKNENSLFLLPDR